MPEPVSDDVARNRWITIVAVRFAGVAMVMIGLLVTADRIPAPIWAGYMLLIIGFLQIFLVTNLLERKWRTPPQ